MTTNLKILAGWNISYTPADNTGTGLLSTENGTVRSRYDKAETVWKFRGKSEELSRYFYYS